MSFANPLGLWFLIALPIIVLLQLLQARRRRRLVSALFLWEQALAEARARRRFRLTVLLLLQLLAAALLALAAARPQLLRPAGGEVAVILDASASMLASDQSPSRFELARHEARRILQRGARGVLIRAGLVAKVLAGPTADLSQLEPELRAAQAGDETSAIEEALALAQGTAPGAPIYL
ncbi:MAG: VWA domain-containing protein, partial [Deinococcus sp.]|nr:VWA domain-containing protein [Deinococcus sp.]